MCVLSHNIKEAAKFNICVEDGGDDGSSDDGAAAVVQLYDTRSRLWLGADSCLFFNVFVGEENTGGGFTLERDITNM